MKNSRFDTIRSLKTFNKKNKLDISKFKSADINILLNKVKLEKRRDLKKKIIYLIIINSIILILGLITFI